jgi:CarD family transcriptional regulator
MFKKGEYVIYPKYGCSKIKKVYKESVGGEDKDYYELIFENTLTVSVPVETAEDMGMRYPLSKKELEKTLKELNKKVKFKPEIGTKLSEISKQKLATGTIADAVELIGILTTMSKKRKDDNKPLDLNERDNLRSAVEFVKSEIVVVLGEKALNKYGIQSM